MSNELIYLDNNATTRIDPAVVDAMMPFLTSSYGNPSSAYRFGRQVADAIGLARERVAALVGCEPSEIIFTSCGTESTNTAIASALRMDRDRQHVVTTRVEHSATLKTCDGLAKRGQPITWLGVDSEGQVDLEELERAITDETALVSVMWANNETGVMFPITEIAEVVRSKGAVFHTDAVQVAGKVPLRVAEKAWAFSTSINARNTSRTLRAAGRKAGAAPARRTSRALLPLGKPANWLPPASRMKARR